jgi:hypothetical protein
VSGGAERFLTERTRQVVLDRVGTDDGCWPWLGSVAPSGYGQFSLRVPRTTVQAHRAVYTILVGPIPDGLELDHVCVNKPCVRPSHLEPVTHAENQRRWGERRRRGEDGRLLSRALATVIGGGK